MTALKSGEPSEAAGLPAETASRGAASPGGRGKRRRASSLRIGIIGAGLGGVCAAVKLVEAGFQDIMIYEAAGGAGGTWYKNRYPGCEVDTESRIYSFSFMPYAFARTHPHRAEMERYVNDIIDRFGLRDRIRFNTTARGADWDTRAHHYTLHLSADGVEEVEEVDVLISATGMLNLPNRPRWPGVDRFRGVHVHSAEWDEDLDVSGKTVAVVGTGSTAAQIVPAVAETAAQVYVFQREPGWVLPKPTRELEPSERLAMRHNTLRHRFQRYRIMYQSAKAISRFDAGSDLNSKYAATGAEFIRTAITDPDLRELVTPRYAFGCKRTVKASTFYPALNLPNVTLVPRAVTSLTEDSVVDDAGQAHEVDIVVSATGFRASEYLAEFPVRGRDGRSVHDVWNGEPKAYLGITVPGIPNFFMMYGPNTNGGGPVTAQHECQAAFIVNALRHLVRTRNAVVDTKPAALDRFVELVDEGNQKALSATLSGCNNYFFSSSGRNVTQWPFSSTRYVLMTRTGRRGLAFSRS